jgi:hypothetical protein
MMNARNLIRKVSQTAGVTQDTILLAVQIILLVAVFCLLGQPALAKSPKNCSQMSKSAFTARKSEIKNDYFIAVGKCYNLPPTEDIKQCIKDAKAEQKDAQDEAKDQRDARLDLCDQVGEDPYNPVLNPADFVDPANIGGSVDPNPYWPLVPGYRWTYKTKDATDTVIETNIVEVLDPAVESVTIQGIPCAVVHDVVYKGDQPDPPDPTALSEDTYDWYGQKLNGDVWYLGEFSLAKQECNEETGELCEGLFADDGSWQAGFDGGKGGILMFGDPSAVADGTVYRQELYLGEAEDAAQKINISDDSVTVPYKQGAGTIFNSKILKNYEFSVLEPGVAENKYYAPGVGVLVEEAIEDGVPTGEVNELYDTNFAIP